MIVKLLVLGGVVLTLGVVAWAASVLNAEYKQKGEEELERQRDREYGR